MNRRDFLRELAKNSAFGTLGVSGLVDELLPFFNSPISPSRDSYNILKQMILRPRQNLFLNSKLYADTLGNPSFDNETAVITIKVMNLIHTPLACKFGNYKKIGADPYGRPWSEKIGNNGTLSLLLAKGVDKISNDPRMAKLFLNKWWADILSSGKDESGTTLPDLMGKIGNFPPESEVALQTFFHLNQTFTDQNHSFKNVTLRQGGGDLSYFLDSRDIIRSPLGISCLSMGQSVETTDGSGYVGNRVLGPNLSQSMAEGKTLGDYLTLLSQSIGTGFESQDLQLLFDQLVQEKVDLRGSLSSSKVAIQNKLEGLRQLGPIVDHLHNMQTTEFAGNVQAISPSLTETARLEFLANCLYVDEMMAMPGRPFRNFSLLLNVFDIDGQKLEVSTAEASARPLSNIEGMRQLAMGLNILSHTIRKHKNVYVLVFSEGGRGANGGDNKVSHGMLMGPGGRSGIVDHAYINHAIFNNLNDPFHAEPNEGDTAASNSPGLTVNGAGLRNYDAGELLNEQSQVVLNQFPDVAAFLTGFGHYLADRTGKPQTKTGLGNYIKIKTG